MKKNIFLLLVFLSLFFTFKSEAQCRYNINLSDLSYDHSGWTDALTIFVNGHPVLTDISVPAGEYYRSYTFLVESGDRITSDWHSLHSDSPRTESIRTSDMKYVLTNNASAVVGNGYFPDDINYIQARCQCVYPPTNTFKSIARTPTSASIYWKGGGTGDGVIPAVVDIEIVKSGDVPTGYPTHPNANTGVFVSNLVPNTFYDIRVRRTCTSDMTWRSLGYIHTLEEPLDPYYYTEFDPLPYNDDFIMEDVNAPYNSFAGIDLYDGVLTCGYQLSYLNNALMLSEPYPDRDDTSFIMYSPDFNMEVGHKYRFAARYEGDGTLKVYVASGSHDASNVIGDASLIYTDSSIASACDSVSELFEVSDTQPYFIAMQVESDENVGVAFDNIYISEASSSYFCAPPVNLDVFDVMSDSASLTWLQDDVSPLSWDIIYGEKGFDTDTEGTLITDVTDNSYSLTGLQPNTEYTYYVKTHCSSTTSSDWSVPFTFRTECGNYTVNYSHDFEVFGEYGYRELDKCWSILGEDYGIYASSTQNYSGGGAVELDGRATNMALVTPQFIDLDSTKQIEFYLYDEDDALDLVVGTLSDPTDFSTFTAFKTFTASQLMNDEWRKYIVEFDTYTGTDKYIGFSTQGGSSYLENLYIDNFFYSEMSSVCTRPSFVTISNETTIGADIDWTANNGETLWDLEITFQGYEPTGIPTYSGVSKPYTYIEGAENTDYDVYVRADCSGDGTNVSYWEGPYSFTTVDFCEDPSDLDVSDITAYTAKLTWTENGEADEWTIAYRRTDISESYTINMVYDNSWKYLTNLIPDTPYEFTVSSYCSSTNSSTTVGPFAFQTLVDVCEEPSDLRTLEVTPDSAVLYWLENGEATQWDVTYRKVGVAGSDVNALINSRPYEIIGLDASTEYEFTVSAHCSESNESAEVGAVSFTTLELGDCTYCESLSYDTIDDFISNVTLYSIDNDSGSEGYEDFTAISTDLHINSTYDIEVEVTVNGDWVQKVWVWIDWNENCSFDDPGEAYNLGETDGTTGTFIKSLSITVPEDTFIGSTRMRVIERETNANLSCGEEGYGETEDYTVNILEALPVCDNPSGLTANNITYENADLDWTENGSATLWDIEIGLQGFTPTGTPTHNDISKPYTWDEGNENTTYDYYVRTDCGADNWYTSEWVGPYTFTIPDSCPAPDNLGISNITYQGADISWHETASATQWDIYITNQGGTAPLSTDTPTINDCTTQPYTWLGGEENTAYEVWVRSDCGDGDTSDWVGSITFETIDSCPAPSGLTVTNQTLSGADLSWTENGTAGQWDIEIGTQGFSPTGTPTDEDISNPFTWSSGSEGTSYDYYVRADCSGDNSDVSDWVGPFTFTTLSPCTVCASEGDLTYNTSTTLVQIGSINNASGKSAYSDYTGINTDLEQTGTYNLNVHVNTDGDYQVNTVVWIDWNQDCDFDDADEEYILGNAENVSDGAVSNAPLAITVPAGATLGSTTMRVSTIYGSTPATSCQTSFDGEVEDYTITVISAPSCPAPSSLVAANITYTSADLSWTENGSATIWDIEIGEQGFTVSGIPTDDNITTSSYIWENGTSGTTYEYYVRADCSGDDTEVSNWTGPFEFTTLIDYCGGDHFTDDGGITGNYSTYNDIVTTINPDTAGDVVTVTFLSFDTEYDNDYLVIYDGDSTSAPEIGYYSGTSIPGPFTSTHSSGALTFEFYAEGTGAGWDATVSCGLPPSCYAPFDLEVGEISGSGANLSWNQNGSVTEWDIEIGVQGFTPTGVPTHDDVSNPYLWQEGTNTTSYDYYVRADCSGDNTDASNWVGPLTFTTNTLCYCLPNLETDDVLWISNTTFNTINNDSDGAEGYEDNTAISTDLSLGEVYTLSVQTYADDDEIVSHVWAWIDWNHDCDFNDEGEAYDLDQTSGISGDEVLTMGITVPGGADLGTTTMRVITMHAGNPIPCVDGNYGQAQDYSINIVDGGVSCYAPIDLSSLNETIAGADLSWIENGTATTWDLEIGLHGFSPTEVPTDENVTNSFTWEDGVSGTYYDFYVRSDCNGDNTDTSSWAGPYMFKTLNDYCGGDLFTDDNNTEGSFYSNNLDTTETIYPDNPAGVVTVTFLSFEVEEGYDSLTIYDGESDADTLLGVFDGDTIPGPFTSTHSSGALTFVFHSDESENYAGWEATISCTDPTVCNDPTALGVSNILYNGATINWTEEGTATNWDLYITDTPIVPDASTTPTVDDTTDNPYVWNTGVENTTYKVWVRSDCGGGDASDWVGSVSFTTEPYCHTPTDMATTGITTTTADLSWIDNAGTEGTGLFDVLWGLQGFDINTEGTLISDINAVTYTLNPPLNPGTIYDWYVRSQCSGSTLSDWSPVITFTTPCETITTFPFVETFEADSPTRDCWTQIEVSGLAQWAFANGSTVGSIIDDAHTGTTNVLFNHWNETTKFVSPMFDLTGITNPSLTFWFAQEENGSSQNALKVYYSNDSGNTWVEIGDYQNNVDFWMYEELLLPYSTSTYQIAFEGIANGGYGNVLDDIRIQSEACSGDVVRWSGTNWIPGIPDANSQVILNADYNIGANGDFDACSIVVNTAFNLSLSNGDVFNAPDDFVNYGEVNISSGGTFVAPDDFVNDGAVFVGDGGSFVQTGTPATVTGSGTFTTEKKTTPYHEYDYTYMATPSATATFQQAFVDAEGAHPNYIWKMETASFNDGDADSFDDEGDDWSHVTLSDVATPGVGYAVLGSAADFPFDPNNMSTGNEDTVLYDGPFNTGNIQVTLVADNDDEDDFNNQNLIGNPYPSAIDIELFHTENAAVVSSTFYFWTHNIGIGGSGGGYAYSFTNDNYSVYTIGTGAAASGANYKSDKYIASGQGFLTEATNPGVITFTNAMRVTGSNTNFLSPMSTEDEEEDRIWLNMNGENGDFRQILVGFFDEATDGFDELYDGPRMPNGNNTDFFSIIEGDDRHFAIQGLHTFNVNKIVKLGLEIVEEGYYSIEIDHKEGVFAESQDIYIYDAYLDVYHNLLDGTYSFTTEVGDGINDRFELRFVYDTTAVDETLMSSFMIYPNPSNGEFKLSWKGGSTAIVQVTDLSGKLILSEQIEGVNHLHEMNLTEIESGVYLIKVNVNNTELVKKIIIK